MFEPTITLKDLVEACAQGECPACWLARRTVNGYIRSFFYEFVNDIKLREGIRSSLGYCEEHTWALLDAELGNALGISIIYHDILTTLRKTLPGETAPSAKAARPGVFGRLGGEFSRRLHAFRQALAPAGTCPACTLKETTLSLALPAFGRNLKTEQLAASYHSSPGMCLPHLRRLLEHIDDPVTMEMVLAFTRAKLDSLDEDLAEFIRKNDYRFQKEGFGSERDAWKRVIPLMAGDRPRKS